MMEYGVVQMYTKDEFIFCVNEMLKAGWKLHGFMTVLQSGEPPHRHFVYFQAFTREVKDEVQSGDN